MGLARIRGGLRSPAQESIEPMYLRRLFAAPGLSARRSRNNWICAPDSRPTGHSAILPVEPPLIRSRRQPSVMPPRRACETAGELINPNLAEAGAAHPP